MKKKAEDLKPGDIFWLGTKRFLIVSQADNGKVNSVCATSPEYGAASFTVGDGMQVESPTLTPAQQHAEEMLALVREASDALANWANTRQSEFTAFRADFYDRATPLLARIDPPKPPSAEELAEILSFAVAHFSINGNSDEINRIGSVLERARAAGLLKGE